MRLLLWRALRGGFDTGRSLYAEATELRPLDVRSRRERGARRKPCRSRESHGGPAPGHARIAPFKSHRPLPVSAAARFGPVDGCHAKSGAARMIAGATGAEGIHCQT